MSPVGGIRKALIAEVYGQDFDYESDELLDVHDRWVSATTGWTFEEIRVVLWEEALDYHFLGGGWPISGWCRCGDHGDDIESFLHGYGIDVNSDGEFYLQDEEAQEDDE